MSSERELSGGLETIYEVIDRDFPDHLARCRRFLRQKSISATGEGIAETAAMVRGFIEAIGGEATLWGKPDFPIVYGRLDRGASKTLIIYGMYDVMPVEESRWKQPPFGAEIVTLPRLGQCVIARGAVNSKGALCGVFNTLKTLHETGRMPPLNLIFTIEGEEEIGSPQLPAFIEAHRPELTADGMVDFDFSQDSRGKTDMHLGLKGIVYMDLICRGGRKGGPESAVHGSVSAWISSPAWRLVHALSSLTDEQERITIPGFYDNLKPPDSADLALLKALEATFDEKAFLREMKGFQSKNDLHGMELLKASLFMPVININGIHSGYRGSGTKTVLPRQAVAKVDIRFGPDLEPEEVTAKFKRHLHDRGFDDIEVRVRDSYPWSKTDPDAPIVSRMVESYRRHGHDPEVWPLAPWAVPYYVFSRILNLPVVSGGLGHGGRQHAANEYMTVAGLRDFEKFVATFLYLMSEETP